MKWYSLVKFATPMGCDDKGFASCFPYSRMGQDRSSSLLTWAKTIPWPYRWPYFTYNDTTHILGGILILHLQVSLELVEGGRFYDPIYNPLETDD